MNIIAAKFKRDRIIVLLLTVLLTSAVAFGCLGFNSWFGIQQQVSFMEEQYTTVAIPGKDFNWSLLYSEEHQKSVPLSQHSELSLPGYRAEDLRCLLGAYVEGTKRLSALEFDIPLYYEAFDMSSMQFAVLAVRCNSVSPTTEHPMSEAIFDENNDIIGYNEYFTCSYEAEFSVLNTICRSDAYEKYPIETVRVCSPYTADMQVPFQKGQTYLLFGFCGDFDTTLQYTDTNDCIYEIDPARTNDLYLSPILEQFGFSSLNYIISTEKQHVEDHIYTCLTPDSIPFYAAYNDSWEDFLNSEEGAVWRDTIIPFCEASYSSARVLLTDNVDSLLTFNDGSTTILDGRKIEKEEYENGADVCLVSAAYAEQNGLSIGDSLTADLYNSPCVITEVSVQQGGSLRTDHVNLQAPLREEDKLNIKKNYTIVGIYTGPEFQPGYQYFDANTIIAPKASVPNSEQYEKFNSHLLYSVILENGREQEFESALEELGFEGKFEYFNQGYGAVAASLRSAEDNAIRLLLSSAGAFLLAAALYLFFIFRRITPCIRSMRLLGVKPQLIRKQVFGTIAVMILLAVLLGTILGTALFSTISNAILSQQITLHPLSLICCILGQLVILLTAGYIWSRIAANQNLMQRK